MFDEFSNKLKTKKYCFLTNENRDLNRLTKKSKSLKKVNFYLKDLNSIDIFKKNEKTEKNPLHDTGIETNSICSSAEINKTIHFNGVKRPFGKGEQN